MSQKHLSLVQSTQEANLKTDSQNPIGFTDPKNPWVFWFEHQDQKKYINFKDLISHSKRKAIQKNRPQWAEDFSQWCVVHNLERIRRGSTEYAHLNNVDWLWEEYTDTQFGTKRRSGPKWERASKTFSYDNLNFEGGGHFLDFQADQNNFNPEEALIIQEELSGREAEIVEALRDKKKENREKREATNLRRENRTQRDNLLYDFLVKKSDFIGFGLFEEKPFAREYKISKHELQNSAKRLEKRKLLIIKNGFFYLPEQISVFEKLNKELEKVS